jgi:hypothetical protein
MPGLIRDGLPSAGIFAGPAAWLAGTQANYALVPWICAHQIRLEHFRLNPDHIQRQ